MRMYVCMVRVNKNFTIEYELSLNLEKEDNASELINNLLDDHFSSKNKQNPTKLRAILSKKAEEMKKLKREIRDYKEDLKILEEKERIAINLASQYPQEIVKAVINCSSSLDIMARYPHGVTIKQKFPRPDIVFSRHELLKVFKKLKGGIQ